MIRRVVLGVAAIAIVGLCSCNKGTSVPESQAPAASAEAPQNTTNFPLYQGSTVLISKGFSLTVNAGQNGTGGMAAGAGTYTGN